MAKRGVLVSVSACHKMLMGLTGGVAAQVSLSSAARETDGRDLLIETAMPATRKGLSMVAPNCVHCWLQEAIKKMIAKWQEPAPAKQTRVLPVPDMEPKKRRGGRRHASHTASCIVCGPCGRARVDKAVRSCLWGKWEGRTASNFC